MLTRLRIFLYLILLALTGGALYVGNSLQLMPSVNASSQLNSCKTQALMALKPEPQQGLNPDNIRFLDWNIYKQQRDNLTQDLSRFAASHDIMTLQEARLDPGLLTVLKNRRLNWIMNSAFYLHGDATGVMTVADRNALYSCGFLVHEPLIYLPKGALVSEYPLQHSAQTLLVANLHGINFSLGLAAYRQQLDLLYQALKSHHGPLIVAGDFNSWSDQRLAQMMALVNKLSLSKLDYSINNKTQVFGHALDYVFYRQLKPLAKQVPQVSSSDHNPISVRFSVIPG